MTKLIIEHAALGCVMEDEFPYEEIRDPDGNYFLYYEDVIDAGYCEEQVWTVVSTDTDEGIWFAYDSTRRIVNVLGYIATKEHAVPGECYEEFVELDP